MSGVILRRAILMSQAMGGCPPLEGSCHNLRQPYVLYLALTVTEVIKSFPSLMDTHMSVLLLRITRLALTLTVANHHRKIYTNQDIFKRTLHIFNEIYCTFLKNGTEIKFSKKNMYICYFELISVFLFTVMFLLGFYQVLNVGYLLVVTVHSVIFMQVVGVTCLCCEPLCVAEACLRKTADLLEDTRLTREKVLALVKVHTKLADACRTLDRLFSDTLLFELILLWIYAITSASSFFVTWYIQVFGVFHYLTIAAIMILSLTVSYDIVFTTVSLHLQEERFQKVLYGSLMKDYNVEILSKDEVPLTMALRSCVQLKALRTFPLDCALVTSMVGASMTYLVILLQMMVPHENQS